MKDPVINGIVSLAVMALIAACLYVLASDKFSIRRK